MRPGDVGALAFESLRRHRMRSGLTIVAVAIGVTAVLSLASLGDAAKSYVLQQFASTGGNVVAILPGRTETGGLGSVIGGSTRPLTLDDFEAVRLRVPAVQVATAISLGSGAFEFGGRHRDVFVVGSTESERAIRDLRLSAGRFLPAGDPRRGEFVVVIGPTLRREIFGDAPAVGRSVRIAGWRFRVIGVLEPKGRALGVDYDDLAIVPVSVGMRMFDQAGLHRIVLRARDAASLPSAIEQTRRILIDRHREEDFTIVTQDAMLRSMRRILDALTLALAGIAAISLAVAGIGIMNVMLVAVSERTAEVGLLKALGGLRRQILALFLTEASLLSGIGALLGVATGVLLTRVATRLWPSFPITPSAVWIVVALAFSIAAGVAFGLMPARRAAGMPAADALRGNR